MIWEPINCGSFLEKDYLRLHENVLEISLKIVYERIYAFTTRGTSYLTCNSTIVPVRLVNVRICLIN